jgi:WD40 repeat protein
MRFSPDGKWLAVGSHDNTIYIYNTTSYVLAGKRGKHHSFITALDWSLDSTALHSTSGDYELLFWSVDASSGRINHLPSGATAFCNEQWATWSTHFGWPVQGIYGGIIDYTHVNRVDRDPNKSFFAIGNDNGEVEIFNNPNNEQSKSRAFVAHSEHVTNVKWSEDGQWLFSTGGYD